MLISVGKGGYLLLRAPAGGFYRQIVRFTGVCIGNHFFGYVQAVNRKASNRMDLDPATSGDVRGVVT